MMNIRDYGDSDYGAVRTNLQEGSLFDPVADTREELLEKITRNPGSIVVAEDQGRVVGNVFILVDGLAAFIFRLAVHSTYRGRGIDSLLMTEAERQVQERGVREVTIFVNNADEELKEYYRKTRIYLHGKLSIYT